MNQDSQAGIKIAGRNINNLRYADETTRMAESEEELKSLLTHFQGIQLGLQLCSGPGLHSEQRQDHWSNSELQ